MGKFPLVGPDHYDRERDQRQRDPIQYPCWRSELRAQLTDGGVGMKNYDVISGQRVMR